MGTHVIVMDKMSMAISYDFDIYRSMPLIPIEISLEIVLIRNTESCLFILPDLYSIFFFKFYVSKQVESRYGETIVYKVKDALKHTDKEYYYLNNIMLAVTILMLGHYEKALWYCRLVRVRKKTRKIQDWPCDMVN